MVEPTPDAALDSLIDAIATQDLPSTLGALSLIHEPAVIGSEGGEAARGRATVEAFFRRIYARPGAFRFEFTQRSWVVHDDVTWLVADGTVVEPDSAAPKSYRLTAVFVREESHWKLVPWSGSEPA